MFKYIIIEMCKLFSVKSPNHQNEAITYFNQNEWIYLQQYSNLRLISRALLLLNCNNDIENIETKPFLAEI